MNEETITQLSPSARWILAGNLIMAAGFLAVSIGQILKAAEYGEPFFNSTLKTNPSSETRRNYFER